MNVVCQAFARICLQMLYTNYFGEYFHSQWNVRRQKSNATHDKIAKDYWGRKYFLKNTFIIQFNFF